jgi:pimeloyl-ACP methyl ester carboxylesterase
MLLSFLRLAKTLFFLVVIFAGAKCGVCAEKLDVNKIGRGFSSQTYLDGRGEPHTYVLFIPHSWRRGQNLPLLMFLNGAGENGDDGFSQIRSNFGPQLWEMQEFFPLIAIAPQCRKGSSWPGNNDDSRWAMEILDLVVKELAADEDRIYLTGVSSGGSGTWNIGSEYANRFAAIAPLCGIGGNLDRITKARLPVWNFINDGDVEALVTQSRKVREALIERGQSPLFTEFYDTGHDCWNATYRLPAFYCWLLEQRKSRNANESLFKYLPPAKILTEWRRQGSANWAELTGQVITSSGGDADSLQISNDSSSNLELHADVWLEAGADCELGLVSDNKAAASQGLRIRFTPLAAGSGGVFRFESNEWVGGMDLAARHSFKMKSWNDVRLRLQDERLTVRINGWQATDVQIHSNVTKSSGEQLRYHFALVSPSGKNETRWRYVRTRELPVIVK